jgi:(p)ppGpp synthase/HD superfamily hydrolase
MGDVSGPTQLARQNARRAIEEREPMSTLERAIVIAAEGHAGVKDKGGAPYILHPLRMMLGLSHPDERIVAVLHDVCEDCPGWTFDRLRAEGFSDHIVTALDAVTKREGEDYEDFARRAAADPIGRNVKLADLADNCDLSRIAEPTEVDHRRIEKYWRAIKLIEVI